MTTDREAGSALLRQLRISRGWSWPDMARALHDTAGQLAITPVMNCQVASIERTIAAWESRIARTRPGLRYQYLLAHLYARTASGDVALGPGSDFETLLDALRTLGTPPDQVDQLADLITHRLHGDSRQLPPTLVLAWPPSLPTSVDAPSRLDEHQLHQLSATVAEINAHVGSVPFVRLQLQLGPIVETCRWLLRLDPTSPRHNLLQLATDAYALAGRMAFETHDDDAALSLYADAQDAAQQLNDPSRLAAVRTSHTMVLLHATDDLVAAHALAKTATIDAQRGPSHTARARAHAVHAETCARAGHPNQARAALDRARKTVDHTIANDSRSRFTIDHLHGFDGLCALYAADAEHAHNQLTRCAASLNQPRDAVQTGIVTTDLALARLQLGDPAACVELLHRAVDITTATRGRVSAKRIRQAMHALRPWRTEQFHIDLSEHIHENLIGH